MNRDGERRMYVQMAPDNHSVGLLAAVGRSLKSQKSGRLLPERELHVTLIHFGKANDVLAAIRNVVELSDNDYEAYLAQYIKETQSVLTTTSYPLAAVGYDRFGKNRTTLVLRYTAPAELLAVHRRAYEALLHFLQACGINNAAHFAEANPNFSFAHTFRPHVTLYKGYDGLNPVAIPPDITVSFMPLEY